VYLFTFVIFLQIITFRVREKPVREYLFAHFTYKNNLLNFAVLVSDETGAPIMWKGAAPTEGIGRPQLASL
jgi:hypothetical protein